jgi:hypothetical protein
VGFFVEMWNTSCASISASKKQFLHSAYSRNVSLLNKMKFIMTISSHRKEMAKKIKRKERRIRRMSQTTGYLGAARCHSSDM